MSTTEAKTTAHATAEQIASVSAAHGDTDAMLAKRVKTVRQIVASGVTVKVLADDLKAAKADDATINAVSSTILGFALAASDIVDLAGVAFSVPTSAELARIYRAAKNVGVKSLKAGMRHALSTLPDDASPADRYSVILTTAETAVTTKVAPKTREPRPASGDVVDTIEEATADQPVGSVRPTAPADPAADALATLHAITRMISNGTIEYSADLANAVAQLTDATSTARKFQKQMQAA